MANGYEYVDTAGGVSPPYSYAPPDVAKQDIDDPGRRGKRAMRRGRRKMRKGKRY